VAEYRAQRGIDTNYAVRDLLMVYTNEADTVSEFESPSAFGGFEGSVNQNQTLSELRSNAMPGCRLN
jgi:hypothetical protein